MRNLDKVEQVTYPYELIQNANLSIRTETIEAEIKKEMNGENEYKGIHVQKKDRHMQRMRYYKTIKNSINQSIIVQII